MFKKSLKYLIIVFVNLILLTILLTIWTDKLELQFNDSVRPIEFLKLIGITILGIAILGNVVSVFRKLKINSVKRKIRIKDGSNILSKTIRIRDQFWSRFNASFYRSKCFKNEGLLSEWEYKGISFGIIENSSKLVDYIIKRALNNKIFFKVPRKFWS